MEMAVSMMRLDKLLTEMGEGYPSRSKKTHPKRPGECQWYDCENTGPESK